MRALVSRCISSPPRHWQTHRLDCTNGSPSLLHSLERERGRERESEREGLHSNFYYRSSFFVGISLFLQSLYWLFLIIFFLLFPSTLIFFSPANAPTTLSPHQGCKNWRSAFQWKPLINTNLHLNCNLILTTYALSVNWISHLKDKAVLELALRQHFKAKCSLGKPWSKILIYIQCQGVYKLNQI